MSVDFNEKTEIDKKKDEFLKHKDLLSQKLDVLNRKLDEQKFQRHSYNDMRTDIRTSNNVFENRDTEEQRDIKEIIKNSIAKNKEFRFWLKNQVHW